MADRLGLDAIDREGRFVVLRFRQNAKVDPARLVKVIGEWPGATFSPPVTLKVDLEAERRPKEAPRAAAGRRVPSGRTEVSWWTARATAGEVKAGFTKEEVLRKPSSDPRAENGIFARLEGLLSALG